MKKIPDIFEKKKTQNFCGQNLIKKRSSINRIVRRILYIKTTQSATTTTTKIAAAWTETIKQTNDIHFFTDNLPSLSHTPLASPSCAYVRNIETQDIIRSVCIFLPCMTS